MTINKDKLPTYSKLEETHNSHSHFIGFVFGLIVFLLFLFAEIKYDSLRGKMYPFYIYAFLMMAVFLISFLYHSREPASKIKAVFRIIDHSDIYLFVAATYTPICLYGITNNTFSIVLLILEWSCALLGIVINLFGMNHKVFKYIAFAFYIIGGWALMIFYPFGIGIDFNVFIFVLIGGIVYTLGAILYGIGSKKAWFHTIFHYFVIAGAVLQFVGIWFLLLQII